MIKPLEAYTADRFAIWLSAHRRGMLLAIFHAVWLGDGSSPDLAEDVMVLIERGLKRWLRFRRDERVDMRTGRRSQ